MIMIIMPHSFDEKKEKKGGKEVRRTLKLGTTRNNRAPSDIMW